MPMSFTITVVKKANKPTSLKLLYDPKNIDITGNANISELVYDALNIKNLNGKITLKDEQLN